MIRRLLLGAVIVIVVAGAVPAWEQDNRVEAAPSHVIGQISFGSGVDANALVTGETVYFDRGNDGVWASFLFSGVSPGADLHYVLRLNGDDFAWGKIAAPGVSSGRMAIPLNTPSTNGKLPGGAYRLIIFEGSSEVGQAGFGIRGGQGADNGNTESNSHGGDDDDDDD